MEKTDIISTPKGVEIPNSDPKELQMAETKLQHLPSLETLRKSPQDIETCCDVLKIRHESHIHQNLVQAIIHYTGYHRPYPKERGKLLPRVRNLHGQLSETFDMEFSTMVEEFLDKKAGNIFFPPYVAEGWDISYFPERLQWSHEKDKKQIRVGLQLLFEHVKNNKVTIDLSDASVSSLFTEGHCENCGGDNDSKEPNKIVKCKNCHLGYHPLCYGIQKRLTGNWYCDRCKIKAPTTHGKKNSYKRQLSEDPDNDWEPESKTVPARSNASRPTKTRVISNTPMTGKNSMIEDYSASGSGSISSSSKPTRNRISNSSVSQMAKSQAQNEPVTDGSHKSYSRTYGAQHLEQPMQTPPSGRKPNLLIQSPLSSSSRSAVGQSQHQDSTRLPTNTPVIERTLVVDSDSESGRPQHQNRSLNNSLNPIRSPMTNFQPLSNPIRISKRSRSALSISMQNSVVTTDSDSDATNKEKYLLIQLGRDSEVDRAVALSKINSIDSLFQELAQRWPEKLYKGPSEIRTVLVKHPVLRRWVEMVRGNKSDWEYFKVMIEDATNLRQRDLKVVIESFPR